MIEQKPRPDKPLHNPVSYINRSRNSSAELALVVKIDASEFVTCL